MWDRRAIDVRRADAAFAAMEEESLNKARRDAILFGGLILGSLGLVSSLGRRLL